MPLTGSASDSFLDILNDSLEENDIGSAHDSDYVEKNDHDSSSEFTGSLWSENEIEEVMHVCSDSSIGRDHVCAWNKQEPFKKCAIKSTEHIFLKARPKKFS
ncbi:hypothetical protein T4E_12333 [Trichinella pseudospiralis]|uniref:Uncharacterized protein n=1 Tax=Trichinella pseudospiralis TaxID=6337 RepID=A0A0V0YFX4_TRIPS|nr:hypothetical protein T4E_12333 [Trichinella pseudospiralis]